MKTMTTTTTTMMARIITLKLDLIIMRVVGRTFIGCARARLNWRKLLPARIGSMPWHMATIVFATVYTCVHA